MSRSRTPTRRPSLRRPSPGRRATGKAFDDQGGSAASQGYPVAEPDGHCGRDRLVVQKGAVLGSGVTHGQPA